MYPIERNLGTTKEFVTNKARPEGSIAEGYIANECLTFCSMYLHGIETKFDREERNYDGGKSEEGDEQSPFFQHVRPFGASNYDFIDPLELRKMHWYMLDNCNDVHKFMNEHKKELETVSSLNLEKRHRDEFPGWFKRRMMNSYSNKLEEATELLYILACGPLERGRTYKSCIVNSVRFHVKERDNHRLSQNSGVMVQGDHEGNLIDYYGILIDVIELAYIKEKRPVFFKCEWFNTNSKSGIRTDTYVVARNEMGNPDRIEFYGKCYGGPEKKDFKSKVAEQNYKEMENVKEIYHEMTPDSIVDVVLGKKSGRIPGLGFGPRPEKSNSVGDASLESLVLSQQEQLKSQGDQIKQLQDLVAKMVNSSTNNGMSVPGSELK